MLCWCQSIQRLLVSFPVPKQNVQTVIHLNSKSISLHTIALTREAKLWGGYPRLPGQKTCKMQDKVSTASPPPGEVGGAKLYSDLTELR